LESKMGVLDDAIREHLELKRKHGAPEDEIQQKEQEALGPPASTLHPPPDATDEPAYEEPALPGPAAEALAPEPAGFYDDEHSAVEEEEILPALDDEALLEAELEPEEDLPAEPLPPPPPSRDFFEDSEPFFEEEPLPGEGRGAADPDEGLPEADDGEDLLEETPEFLQDTPEGDRLWFEQKPPKDFDFDD
jgi:hypothetical protein